MSAGGTRPGGARGTSPSFEAAVAEVVRAIPRGEVLSYGDVAKRAGAPRASRAVARALGRSKGLPWWRVIRSDRTLAQAVAAEQARLLRAEGVAVVGDRVVRAGSRRRRP
ncbi:MAG TPA: MGMT family protein [Vulgatibacter sp.]|nr:MGMT family protein [Vulgatibacter sp.]